MKHKIKNRNILNDGNVVLSDKAILDLLYQDHTKLNDITVKDSEEIHEYNKWAKIYDYPSLKTEIANIDHLKRIDTWLIPDEFKNLDVKEYIEALITSEEELNRVNLELKEFEDRNLINLLRFLIYLVYTLRKNNIIWGVGRGSSVSSYILYLIGLHKVNSLKYNLDITEFFKN